MLNLSTRKKCFTILFKHLHLICAVNNTTMVKRKSSATQSKDPATLSPAHSLTPSDVCRLRGDLLSWYDVHQRELPWRSIAKKEKDINKRLYSVWVSEIMLQQTQVATVIDYYNKWIKRWPTVEELAKATLEEVNEMWSGLGYYSRGRRLHEGALKVMNDLDGEIPRSAKALMKQLPGVGRYTAGAIASIALGQVTGLVDGNVSRVFSRLCVIGADITDQHTTEAIWSLATDTVDPDRPGDYNQALMELGATVCTPKAPQCVQCPVQGLCKAYSQVEAEKDRNASKLLKPVNTNSETTAQPLLDIECVAEACKLCLPDDQKWEPSDGVQNYPRKGKKKAPREQRACVCVLHRPREVTGEIEYLLVQRPETGLLANLWEFPSVAVALDITTTQAQSEMTSHLSDTFSVGSKELKRRQYISEVVHIFSHIHQTYSIESASVANTDVNTAGCDTATRWVTAEELSGTAISTAMKKVFKAYESRNKKGPSSKPSSKSDGKKQLGLGAFFKKA